MKVRCSKPYFCLPCVCLPCVFQGQDQVRVSGSELREVTEGVKILPHYTLHGFPSLAYNHCVTLQLVKQLILEGEMYGFR